jgi:hypothetical protein
MGYAERERYVVHTMVMRLDLKNSQKYLSARGHDISLKQLEKDRHKIRNSELKQKFEFIADGLWKQHTERIHQLEVALDLAWENYHNESDPFKKTKILAIIVSIQPLLSNYHNDSQAIIENDAELKRLYQRREIQQATR